MATGNGCSEKKILKGTRRFNYSCCAETWFGKPWLLMMLLLVLGWAGLGWQVLDLLQPCILFIFKTESWIVFEQRPAQSRQHMSLNMVCSGVEIRNSQHHYCLYILPVTACDPWTACNGMAIGHSGFLRVARKLTAMLACRLGDGQL